MRIGRLFAALLLTTTAAAAQQQMVDPGFKPHVAKPAYATAPPVIAIDEAHANFHTAAGRYAPFAALMRADGATVRANTGKFDAATLAGVDVLVIANARARGGESAFAPAEQDALHQWVTGGGALLLIADHAPFGSATAGLARRFGIDMGQGYVVARGERDKRPSTRILFTRDMLGKHPIIAGRDGETVRRVRSFTGQSLSIPDGAVALLRLPKDAVEVADANAVSALVQGRTVAGSKVGERAQALAMTLGKGRVVVLGEAGMLTAQILQQPGGGTHSFGMSDGDNDNQQFALNIMHWLTRLTG